MFTMPMATVVVEDQDTWTVASLLGLRTNALQFDPTMGADFDGEDPNGLSMLEKYVDRLLEGSFANSPLFWHYAVRHVPSDSIVCESVVRAPQEPTTLTFEEEADDRGFPQTFILPSNINVPKYGYDAFPLGGVDTHCFCGWHLVANNCIVPEPLCTERNLASCNLAHGSLELHAFTDSLMDDWTTAGTWDCPETDLSDSWGIVPTRYISGQIRDKLLIPSTDNMSKFRRFLLRTIYIS
jgi:hypothetical protein